MATGGFWSRFGAQVPGMTNSIAHNFGDPNMAETVQNSSALIGRGRNKGPRGPKMRKGIPRSQMPGQQMSMPTMPQFLPTIDTGPTMAQPLIGGSGMEMPILPMMGGSPYGRIGNTGITGGLFNRFNRLSGQGMRY